MNVSFWIAKRYLFAKKSHNIINLISIISLIGISVATGAMFIVLSMFNGLQNFIGQTFNAFNPDLEITPQKGKIISDTTIGLSNIIAMPDVEYCSGVLADKVVFVKNQEQYITTMKGVATDYARMTRMDTIVTEGNFLLKKNNVPFAVLGGGVAYRLNCNINNPIENQLKIYYPDRTKKRISATGTDAVLSQTIIPSGVFHTYTNYDNQFVFVPIDFARSLFNYPSGFTSIEIKCKKNQINKVQKQLTYEFGDRFFIKNAYQQEEDLYKVMQSEKWAIYLILSFILLIASFNMMGMMSILILEKKNQIGTLFSLGISNKHIKQIFLYEGLLIVSIGVLIGFVIGLIFCFLQYKFGIISYGDGSYLISAYPVQIQFTDIMLIAAVVLLIALPTIYIPTKKLTINFTNNS